MHQYKRLLNKIYQHAIKKINYYKKDRFSLPLNPQHDDVYLVEFPKSGVTWLSFLIGNINLIKSDSQQRMTYYNHHQYIPDIHVSRQLKPNLLPFPGFRVIKSHSEYNPMYSFVILLIRNPFDVMISYYHFTKSLNQFNGSLMEFIKDDKFGIDAWMNHLSSWINRPIDSQRLFLLRYEDLKCDTMNELKQLYGILGFSLDDEVIEESIKRCQFEEMKKDESFYKSRNPYYNINFMRKGKSTDFKNEMNKEMIDYICSRSGKYLEKFYSDLKI